MAYLTKSLTIIASLAVPTQAFARRLGAAAGPNISITRIFAALLLCLLVAVAVIAIIRVRSGLPLRLSIKNMPTLGSLAARRLEVIESRRMSQYADLCLVGSDGQEYLIACGPGGFLLLNHQTSTDTQVSEGQCPGGRSG